MRQEYKLLLSALIISTLWVLPPTPSDKAKKHNFTANFYYLPKETRFTTKLSQSMSVVLPQAVTSTITLEADIQ